jgi:DNA-binding beta-propeller fold protein YncE
MSNPRRSGTIWAFTFVAITASTLASCGWDRDGAIPSQTSDLSTHRVPHALHFVPFVGTCVQRGSTCAGGGIQSFLRVTTITNGIDWPYALQYDASNNLYAANLDDSKVTVYSAGSLKLKSTIREDISSPDALAFDPLSAVLYVANNCAVAPGANCSFSNTVTAYQGGLHSFTLTVHDGIHQPVALAVDHMGDLYVANAGSNWITEYASAGHAFMRKLHANGPAALVVDRDDNLWVANYLGQDVAEYKPAPGPTRALELVQVPGGAYRLAIDSRGYLYVGTLSSVFVYACPPQCRVPAYTINDVHVAALGIDPRTNDLFVAEGGLSYSRQDVQEYSPNTATPFWTSGPISQIISSMAVGPTPKPASTPSSSPKR